MRKRGVTSVKIIIRYFEVVVLFSQMRGDLKSDFKMMVDGGTITNVSLGFLLLISVSYGPRTQGEMRETERDRNRDRETETERRSENRGKEGVEKEGRIEKVRKG